MFDKLRHRNQTPTPTPEDFDKKLETNIAEIQTKLNDLHAQSEAKHSKIMATKQPSVRTKLQLERNPILEEIRILTTQKDMQTELQASRKLDQLLHKTLSERTIVLQVNGHRQKISKDLMIDLKFNPCKHVKKIHLKELHSYRKSIPTTNVQKYILTKWQSTLTTNTVITQTYNCDECRAKKKRKLKLTGRRTAKDIIGKCHVSLSIL